MKAAGFFALAVGMSLGFCIAGYVLQRDPVDYVQFIGATLLTAGAVILIVSNVALLGVGMKHMLDGKP